MIANKQGMIGVPEARKRAEKYYTAHYREWAADLVLAKLTPKPATEGKQEPINPEGALFTLNLRVPTERHVLETGNQADLWAAEWNSVSEAVHIQWVKRNWSRVGPQTVPERITIKGYAAIAAFARKGKSWQLLVSRLDNLLDHLCHRWPHDLLNNKALPLAAASKRSAALFETLSNAEWQKAMLVLDWLSDHSHDASYIRQLPIRGIDTKWLGNHRSVIEPLYTALTDAKFSFSNPPYQVRIRFLDTALSPLGLYDLSILPSELAHYPHRPKTVIVCENLVSLLSLPTTQETLGIFGGGYAVSELSQISWLGETNLLYWGDLDSNGFAILNQLRCYFPSAKSLMMDTGTLKAHRDLCVIEEKPNRGTLEHLTHREQETLNLLLEGKEALRLEQERIEWQYAIKYLQAAL